MSKSREIAKDFINTFSDIYENYTENDIDRMTDQEAKQFVIEHLEFIIGTNGINSLWSVEREAIRELNLEDLLKFHEEMGNY